MDYSFGIKNFHAIGSAELSLKGITVLAGINGCGKSTIARSLFSLINSMSEYETIQQKRFCRILAEEIERADRLVYRFGPLLRQARYSFDKLAEMDEDMEESAKNLFFSYVDKVESQIINNASEESKIFLQSAYRYLLDENTDKWDVDYLIGRYREHCIDFYDREVDILHKNIKNRNIDSLNIVVSQEYPDCESTAKIASFKENDVDLLFDNQFLSSLTLDRVVYIDTPMVLSMDRIDRKTVWGRFLSLMYDNNTIIFQDEDKLLKLRMTIQAIIGGTIKEEINLGRKELHYASNGGLNLDIKNTATGIKSFAYILRLLENGWLNSNSLLIIDEPEAHLHPQWVVEFAKVLVLLQKELGVKVLVASHDPDMVAAIHDMSEYYNLSDKTNFYIAKENGDHRYDYHCLGNEIGDIFEAFNVALTKIEAYSVEER